MLLSRQSARKFMMMALPLIFVIGIALLLLVRLTTVGTHHRYVRVELPDRSSDQERLADFVPLMSLVDKWADSHSFYRVTDTADPVRLSWSTSIADGDEQVIHFKEVNPQDAEFPTEALIAFDPDSDTRTVFISIVEGYRRKASERLVASHADLVALLRESYGAHVSGGAPGEGV